MLTIRSSVTQHLQNEPSHAGQALSATSTEVSLHKLHKIMLKLLKNGCIDVKLEGNTENIWLVGL